LYKLLVLNMYLLFTHVSYTKINRFIVRFNILFCLNYFDY
jgi:hypothetical protein